MKEGSEAQCRVTWILREVGIKREGRKLLRCRPHIEETRDKTCQGVSTQGYLVKQDVCSRVLTGLRLGLFRQTKGKSKTNVSNTCLGSGVVLFEGLRRFRMTGVPRRLTGFK